MMNEAKMILDFESDEFSEDLKEKLIDAIKNGKKVYPIKVSIVAEYDEVILSLSMVDKDNNDCFIGQISFGSTEFHCLMGDAGYLPNLEGYDKMSKQEKEELIKEANEDVKHNPFKDKVKEIECKK